MKEASGHCRADRRQAGGAEADHRGRRVLDRRSDCRKPARRARSLSSYFQGSAVRLYAAMRGGS